MTQHSTWGNAVQSTKRAKKIIPFRGYNKITDDMSDAQRRGAEQWNEMVQRLVETGEMKEK